MTTVIDVAGITKLLNSYAAPGTTIEIGFPDDYEGSGLFFELGGQSNLNGLHHMFETPSIVRKIFWAAENGYDAVISSNTFDPGVDGGRLAVDIPVIGLLRTSMHAALTLADKVGVTVPLDPHVPYTRRILRACGLEHPPGACPGQVPVWERWLAHRFPFPKKLRIPPEEGESQTVQRTQTVRNRGCTAGVPRGSGPWRGHTTRRSSAWFG